MKLLYSVHVAYETDSGNEKLTNIDSEKATILCSFFSSIYTTEPVAEFDELPKRAGSTSMENVQFSEEDYIDHCFSTGVPRNLEVPPVAFKGSAGPPLAS